MSRFDLAHYGSMMRNEKKMSQKTDQNKAIKQVYIF